MGCFSWNPLGEAVSQPLGKAADALAIAAAALGKAAEGGVFKPYSDVATLADAVVQAAGSSQFAGLYGMAIVGVASVISSTVLYYGLVQQQAPAQAAAAQAAAAQAQQQI